jgi:hypothetical protein
VLLLLLWWMMRSSGTTDRVAFVAKGDDDVLDSVRDLCFTDCVPLN